MEFLILFLIFFFVALLAGRLSGAEARSSVDNFEEQRVREEEDYITRSMFDDSDDEFFYSSRDYDYEDDITDPTKCYLPYNIYHDSCFGREWDSFSVNDDWYESSSSDDWWVSSDTDWNSFRDDF